MRGPAAETRLPPAVPLPPLPHTQLLMPGARVTHRPSGFALLPEQPFYQHFGGRTLPRPHCLESFGHPPPFQVLHILHCCLCRPPNRLTMPAPPAPLAQVLAGLKAAEAADPALRFPKLLYTVPTGQNPTGCTITSERRRAVYRLCQRYNLLLVEDDPYFFLQYPSGPGGWPRSSALLLLLRLVADAAAQSAASAKEFPAPGPAHTSPARPSCVSVRRLGARPARPRARRQLPQPGHRGAGHPRRLLCQVHGAWTAPGLGGRAPTHR